jgi:serine/threonine protein phosphatase PrpC
LSQSIDTFGASVRGPLHQRQGRPNEDSWLHARGAFGSLIVVCDGMGSRPDARAGSRAACAAVKEAALLWCRVNGAPSGYLAHLIEVLWRLRLHPIRAEAAATTCLLALLTAKGSCIVGGVGDGLAMVRTGKALEVVVGNRGDGFSNETAALGASSTSRAWTLADLPPTDAGRVAVLATDGVSDDLLPERLDGFCTWLVEEFAPMVPQARHRSLTAALRAWPTPNHLDDKSLAVLHAPGRMQERAT